MYWFFVRLYFFGVFFFFGFFRDVFYIKYNRWVSSNRGCYWFIRYNVRGKIGNVKFYFSSNIIRICSRG